MEIIFDKEAKDKIISGVIKMAKAVGTTMGPNGSTVIIPDKDNYGKYKITKDGVSVAKEIFFKCPLENIGAQMLKEVAELQLKLAGDGTTTAVILAAAFVENLRDFNYNDIKKAFDEIIPKVIEQLKINSKELKLEDVKHVANISSNGDEKISNIIQEAYNFSTIVKCQESNNLEDKLELINGMKLDVSYLSKHFITNKDKGICQLINPNVLIIDGHLNDLKPYSTLINTIHQENKSLLIIVEHVHEAVLRILESKVLNNNLNLCIIKSPGFSTHRKNLLEDIALFTGTTVIKNHQVPFIIGKLESCTISHNQSILLKDKSVNIDNVIKNLENYSKQDTIEKIDKDLLLERIENLKGKISVIKVGGQSELEMKERYDRYDDAIRAVTCALEEGIVEGGGCALSNIKNIIDVNNIIYEQNSVGDYILKSLGAPTRTITDNGAEIYRFDNMFNLNIIDPLKVTRTALENAVAVAKTILSTNAVVLNSEQWNS